MKLEPQILHAGAADWTGFVVFAGVVAAVASIAAVAEARRGPSTALGWLCGLALLAVTVLAVLVGSVSAGYAAETCLASQYGVGDGYHGRRAADGSIFNTYASRPFTVAHRTHPFGAVLEITSLATGRSIRAVVTDRGPFVAGRCVDLGRAGAVALGTGDLGRVRLKRVR